MTTTIKERGLIQVAPADLERLQSLYESGDYLAAYQASLDVGPLARWSGAPARLFAGRLAVHLGAARLALKLHEQAWREAPQDPETRYYRGRTLLNRRGPWETWRFLQNVGPIDEASASDEIRADWEALYAMTLAGFRDFERAEARLASAERLTPGRAWLLVERSSLLEAEDRYDEALAVAREALAITPWYRPAVQATAHFLQLLDREAEALELLEEADGRLNVGSIAAQRSVLLFEAGRIEESAASLDRLVSLSPLMETPLRRWIAGRRSDLAYRRGDVATAVALARAAEGPFFREVADRMEAAGPEDRSVRLRVRFVRQHRDTCAPATLAAITRFWGRDADHLEVAQEICYDGTPDDRERSWAEADGWRTREFTVTWDAAVALLDRGVPFTLTTVEPMSGHLQAVIGYDARRGTFLIRDPSLPHEAEALAEPLLERYRSVGPRGMAMVPVDRSELLDGIDLPEADLYDRLYQIKVSLRNHDRDAAATEYEAMQAVSPDARLTLHARRILAIYDDDAPGDLNALEALRNQYPDDVNLKLFQLSRLRDAGRRDDRLALYREACSTPQADPLLYRQYAEELLADARERTTAARLIAQAMHARPTDPGVVFTFARLVWEEGRFDESLELHRFASCLGDKIEWIARAYFSVSRIRHREDEALQTMRDRFRRFGAQSSLPGRTLHGALTMLSRNDEAQKVLDEALTLRPKDGDLLLFGAESAAAVGEFERAAALVEEARPFCRRSDWLRAAAALASARGDLHAALAFWRETLANEPTAIDAVGSVAGLLADTEGRPAALAHLREAAARLPHNYPIQEMLVERLRNEDVDEYETALRRLIDLHPASDWARRALALRLSESNRHEEAWAEMTVASAVAPGITTEASVRGEILENAGRIEEARDAYREALRRDVENEPAVARLFDLCESPANRVETAAFLEAELERQVLFGEGLLTFARHARRAIGSDALLATLLRAWESRPDLWHAWSALIAERVERKELDEAEQLARRAAEKFPLLPRIQLDLALVLRARNNVEEERAALRKALQISPGWGRAACTLAHSLEGESLFEESRNVLERAVAYSPLDAVIHGYLADALWSLGENAAARERITVSLRLDPAYDWAWDALTKWAAQDGDAGVEVALAREIVRDRAGDPRAWLALARVLEREGPEALDERLEALAQAAALSPREIDVHDLRAQLLAEAGRFDEAETACAPPAWNGRPPLLLRGRAAWVAAQRGNVAEAVSRMRRLLDETPDYAWGCLRLTEWLRDAEDPKEWLNAAERSAELCVGDAWALSLLGEARLRNEDRSGAKEAFRRILEIAPRFDFAALNLFDLAMEDGELDTARDALAPLQASEYSVPALLLAREVQWHAAQWDRDAAVDALRRLAVAPDWESNWPWEAADAAFASAGWKRFADGVYHEALARPEAAPKLGYVWASTAGFWRTPRNMRVIRRFLKTGGDAAWNALNGYIKGLAERGDEVRLRLFILRNRRRLRTHVETWGMVGYALFRMGARHSGVRWMKDWRDRENVQPWMLYNLANSLRWLGRDIEAFDVDIAALESPDTSWSSEHRVWLALDALEYGEVDVAANLLDLADSEQESCKYLHGLATILVDVSRADPADSRTIAEAAIDRIRTLDRTIRVDAADLRIARRMRRRAAGLLRRRLPRFISPFRWIRLRLSSPRAR